MSLFIVHSDPRFRKQISAPEKEIFCKKQKERVSPLLAGLDVNAAESVPYPAWNNP